MAAIEPGLAFCLDCGDSGFAVGVATHDVPRKGTLVWMAEPLFDAPPSLDEVAPISGWRWPVFFPLAHALRHDWVTRVGVIPVPAGLEEFPLLRGTLGPGRWGLVRYEGGKFRAAGPTEDPSLPVNKVVNDTALRTLIVTGYRPEDEWRGPVRSRNPEAT